ncbi:related to D-amino acid oxidase [Mycolicibacterium canariasense]|uniref:Related to D-amino acid oxidase n=1 Tax=Mycolicibacterium canariasense TaxID=228230 RepID=A0A117IA03_MYCCR|nr:related to D-amino acid oxidase [Mycolicibacterium canariasense]
MVYNDMASYAAVKFPLTALLAVDAAGNAETDRLRVDGAHRARREAPIFRPRQRKSRRNNVRRLPALAKDLYQAVRSRDDYSKHSMVRAVGFEPTRSLEHRHLKPACLPFHHARKRVQTTARRSGRSCRWLLLRWNTTCRRRS